MPPQMVCPSMWTSVTEKTKAHPVLCVPPTEGPALEWLSAVPGRTSRMWRCLFTSCSVGFPCSKDTLLFLPAANQVGWPSCCFLAVTCYTLGSCTPLAQFLGPFCLPFGHLWHRGWLVPWLMRSVAPREANEVAPQIACESCTTIWHPSHKLQ